MSIHTADHRNYMEGRVSEVLEPGRVLDMVGGRAGYRRFVLEGLKDGHREDYYRVEDQRFLGAEGFAQKLKRKSNEEEIPVRKKQLSVAFRSAARAVEVEPQVLEGADRSWEVSQLRALVGYVLIRRLGYKLKDVAKCLGRDVATVSSFSLALRRSYERERNFAEAGGATSGRLSRIESLTPRPPPRPP